jgi:hypothetical protein
MMRLWVTLKRIFADILAGKNIETYVVAFLGVGLTIATVIDNAISPQFQMTIILAALSLLVFKSSAPPSVIPNLEEVLQDRHSFGAFHDLIDGARSLYIYAPTAANVLREAPYIIREILEKGGEVRVIVQDPDKAAGMELLDGMLDKTGNLKRDIEGSLDFLERMKVRSTSGKMDYRFLPFSPGFSIVIIDRNDNKKARMVVEFLGFRNEFITDRMHIDITRQQSQRWFEYWADQYDRMWEAARSADEAAA